MKTYADLLAGCVAGDYDNPEGKPPRFLWGPPSAEEFHRTTPDEAIADAVELGLVDNPEWSPPQSRPGGHGNAVPRDRWLDPETVQVAFYERDKVPEAELFARLSRTISTSLPRTTSPRTTR